jgi:hypothetical protein
MAEVKSAQMNKDIQAMSDYGIINGSGNVTDVGETAFGIASSEKYGAMTAKNKAFENFDAKHFKQRAIETYMEKHHMNKNNLDDINKASHAVEKEMNRLGLTEDATPEQIAGAVAAMGATNYSSSKSLNFLGMNMNMGLGGDGSSRIDTQGGEKTSISNTTEVSSGRKETLFNDVKELVNTNPQARVALMAAKTDKEAAEILAGFDAAKWGSDLKNVTAMGGIIGIKKTLDALGIEADTETMGLAGGVAGGIFAGAGGMMALEKMTKDGGKYLKADDEFLGGFERKADGYYDNKGNMVFDKEGYLMDSRGRVANPNYGKGVVSRTASGTWNALAGTSEDFTQVDTSKPLNQSTNGSTNQYDTPHNQGVGNNSHVNPPSNNMSNSTTKSGGGASGEKVYM